MHVPPDMPLLVPIQKVPCLCTCPVHSCFFYNVQHTSKTTSHELSIQQTARLEKMAGKWTLNEWLWNGLLMTSEWNTLQWAIKHIYCYNSWSIINHYTNNAHTLGHYIYAAASFILISQPHALATWRNVRSRAQAGFAKYKGHLL